MGRPSPRAGRRRRPRASVRAPRRAREGDRQPLGGQTCPHERTPGPQGPGPGAGRGGARQGHPQVPPPGLPGPVAPWTSCWRLVAWRGPHAPRGAAVWIGVPERAVDGGLRPVRGTFGRRRRVAGMKGAPGACVLIMRPCAQQARLNGQRIPSSCEMARAADGQVRKAACRHIGAPCASPRAADPAGHAEKRGAAPMRDCPVRGARGYCAPSALTDARLTSGL